MKAKINGIEVEGTPEEILEYQKQKDDRWDVFAIDDRGHYRRDSFGVSRQEAEYLCQENRNYRAYKQNELSRPERG